MPPRVPLLVSACLLGKPCRYDGRAKPLPPETLRRLEERYRLVPVCPEQDGGLPTPRVPAERVGSRVLTREGRDVTAAYQSGGLLALRTARSAGCTLALLKELSPSCGSGTIYDGSFTGGKVPGNGTTTELLLSHGLTVVGESQVERLLG